MQKILPKVSGVYLFKDKSDQIIYIGKAKNINNRVKSYFQKNHDDWKVQALLQEYSSLDYIVTKNETEALLLEAQLVRNHKPKFNVLLKEGQPFVYLLFTRVKDSDLSILELVRNKKKKGFYFGPFLCKQQARKVYHYLVKTFRLNLCNKKIENGCLDYHLGLCAGNCKKNFDFDGYLFRLEIARNALKKNHKKLIIMIKEKIASYNRSMDFEKAMHIKNYLDNIDIVLHTLQTKFNEKKYHHEIEKKTMPERFRNLHKNDIADQLQKFLSLKKPIYTIDCFDISHFQSSSLVGSCVRFTNGMPDKNKFRKFKIKTLSQQNDYAALQEIVSRRYKKFLQGDTVSDFPDLILIDGGKGQLSAVQKIIKDIPCISLVKKQETVFGPMFPDGFVLDVKKPVGQLLISLRDYAHHFAINYHRNSLRTQYFK
ncbi:GIY-YIG nuclease family protein [bacterium]|nr:GIY-YIG nuclease family protein [bacterium]